MALNIYCGLMGHGKTYACVKEVIVPNFSKGRHIVSNIEGLNVELIKAYCFDKKLVKSEDDFGTIKIVHDDELMKPNFFPSEEVDTDGNVLKIVPGICQPGDLIVIDEAWKYFQKSEKITKVQDTFLRKMRHYVNEFGHTSDLVLITQDHTMLSQSFKNLCEMLFYTKKLKTLGARGENTFVLTIYEGNKTTRTNEISHSVHTYDKEIFPLYKSYSKENAKEGQIDKRTSFFNSPKFRWTVGISIFLIFSCAYMLYSQVKKYDDRAKEEIARQQAIEDKKKKVEGKTATSPQVSSNSAVNGQVATSSSNSISTLKTITGAVVSDNRFLIFVKDENKNVKVYNNPICNGSGSFMVCDIDNEKINYYK